MASSSADYHNDDRVTLSFGCDYAKSSKAKCHGKSCDNEISEGTLRLSRLIRNPFIPQSSTRDEQLMPMFYHVQCFVNHLRSGKETKKRVNDVENDLQGFDQLKKKDQDRLKRIFSNEHQVQEKLSDNSDSAETVVMKHGEDKKFWQISIDGRATRSKYGLLNEQDSKAILWFKQFSSEAQAKSYVQKKIAEKLRRGYRIDTQVATKVDKQRGARILKRRQSARQQLQRRTSS